MGLFCKLSGYGYLLTGLLALACDEDSALASRDGSAEKEVASEAAVGPAESRDVTVRGCDGECCQVAEFPAIEGWPAPLALPVDQFDCERRRHGVY